MRRAYRTGKKIEWDYEDMRARYAPEAGLFVKRPEYRKGWEDILKFAGFRSAGPQAVVGPETGERPPGKALGDWKKRG